MMDISLLKRKLKSRAGIVLHRVIEPVQAVPLKPRYLGQQDITTDLVIRRDGERVGRRYSMQD